MRAHVLEHPRPIPERPLRLLDRPRPKVDPGQILIEVQACGVCRTDLHTVEGDLPLPRLPLTPGHQVVGRVAELGEGVTGFARGQRVGAVWLYRTCGQCGFCRSGRENLCPHAQFTGWHADGGYAEAMVIDAAFAHPLPAGVADAEIAPLLCGGVIGYRALRLSEIAPGGVLGLYGFGNSAHITIQIARWWGCRVFVFTRSPGHQAHARALGAAWVGQAGEPPPHLLDAAILFAPAGELVPAALRVLKPGGVVACAGIHMTPLPQMPYDLLYGERTLRSVANSTRQDVRDLLHLAAQIPLAADVVTFPLAEANEVLLALQESRFNGDAVLLP
ncbi:MAG: zinc-dependent alcohol dehydrogenase family protein [Caldilineales bacterium]|nr:zinc-dependent alcohol dehydrogenase family protein [Caldilineales bacterium]